MKTKKLTRQQIIDAISYKYKIKKSFIVLFSNGTAMIYSNLKDAEDAEKLNIDSIRGTNNDSP